ncbi:hypothetical protein AMTRI_Chr02g222340 [Amborella trichopoda]
MGSWQASLQLLASWNPFMELMRSWRTLSRKRKCHHEEEVGGAEEERCWSELPPEVLCLVIERLTMPDFVRATAVCKPWAWVGRCGPAKPTQCKLPWLLVATRTNGSESWHMLDVLSGSAYVLSLSDLEGCKCHSSRQGWLLCSKGSSIFFLNPFSKARIDLPKLRFPFDRAIFSGPPRGSSSGCLVILFRSLGSTRLVSTWQPGDEDWKSYFCLNGRSIGQIEDAAFGPEGWAYCIDTDMNLGAFNTNLRTWKGFFPLPLRTSGRLYCSDPRLMEADNGDIYMAVTHWANGEIGVVVLGICQMMETNRLSFLPWKPVQGWMLMGSASCFVESEKDRPSIKTDEVIRYMDQQSDSPPILRRYSAIPREEEEKPRTSFPILLMPREPYLCAIWVDPMFNEVSSHLD